MKKQSYLELRNRLRVSPRGTQGFKHFGIDLSLLSIVVALGGFNAVWWGLFLSVPLIAMLMFRNFSMMHEAVHSAAAPSSRFLNNAIGVWSGALCLLPFEPWKKIHLEHHLWSGNIDRDPSMSLVKIFPRWPKALRSILNFAWKMWLPVMACLQYAVFGFHSLRLLRKNWSSWAYMASVFVPILVWGAILTFASKTFLLAALLPGVILYFLAIEVVNFPHHLELPKLEGDRKDKLWDQHKTARSCVYPRWISEYVVLNFNYHIEHHLYPRAPWHQLPAIHKALSQRLGESYNSDPQFAWILKNRKRKLEDILADEGESHRLDFEEPGFNAPDGQSDRSKLSA